MNTKPANKSDAITLPQLVLVLSAFIITVFAVIWWSSRPDNEEAEISGSLGSGGSEEVVVVNRTSMGEELERPDGGEVEPPPEPINDPIRVQSLYQEGKTEWH